MRRPKVDKRTEKAIRKGIESLVSKYSLAAVTHGVMKWNRERMVRNSVEKERQKLRARLAEIS